MKPPALIDGGRAFNWDNAAPAYAKYRDIYPEAVWRRFSDAGIGKPGQEVLDLGTGTGVLPRRLAGTGARFTGLDASPGQIAEARRLSNEAGLSIRYLAAPAEEAPFPENSFNAITALQCFFYFNHARLAPRLAGMMRPGGKLALLYMGWLPAEDEIAAASEALVLRYNPAWTGGGGTRRPILIPRDYVPYFAPSAPTPHPHPHPQAMQNAQYESPESPFSSEIFDLDIPFTRESWDGRIRSCRGIGAALSAAEAEAFGKAHREMLSALAPETFTIRHYAAFALLALK